MSLAAHTTETADQLKPHLTTGFVTAPSSGSGRFSSASGTVYLACQQCGFSGTSPSMVGVGLARVAPPRLLLCYACAGQKLSQGTYIAAIAGQGTLLRNLWWTLGNNAVAVAGSYLAALVVDMKWCGRTRMQRTFRDSLLAVAALSPAQVLFTCLYGIPVAVLGIIVSCVAFGVSGAWYDQLAAHSAPLLQALYFIGTFFGQVIRHCELVLFRGGSYIGRLVSQACVCHARSLSCQFGPNSTTWLLGAELFPTEARASAHGFTAAVGKAGAMTGILVLSHLSVQWGFIASALVLAAAFFFSILFVPDVTGLSVAELDLKWSYDKAGRRSDYFGPAIDRRYLSVWEATMRSAMFREPSRVVLPLNSKGRGMHQPLLPGDLLTPDSHSFSYPFRGGAHTEVSWTLTLDDDDPTMQHRMSNTSTGSGRVASGKRGSNGQAGAVHVAAPVGPAYVSLSQQL